MQRFSTWARWIAAGFFTLIVIPLVVEFLKHLAENAGIYDRPRETAGAVLNFFLTLSEQTWLRVTALLLGGFVAGLWVDWFLRRLDGSRAKERKALGDEMLNLGNKLRDMKYDTEQARPQIMSHLAAVRKLGIWVPDDRIFSIHTNRLMNGIRSGGSYMEPTREVVDYVKLDNMIKDYLIHVGTMLKDEHFQEAKRYAVNSKAAFDKVYAEHGLFVT